MIICSISDTHCRHSNLTIPECDLLIHCGDWTSRGYKHEVEAFAKWLNKQTQCRHIVVIPGNHELEFEKNLPESLSWVKDHCPRAHLLIDESVEIEGIKIHGSSATPWFCDWAWNRASGKVGYHMRGRDYYPPSIKPHWDKIPLDTNILITHGPVYGILDVVEGRTDHLGCVELKERIKDLKELDIHFCGHIHTGHGEYRENGVSYYNVAICGELDRYYPIYPVRIVEYIKV